MRTMPLFAWRLAENAARSAAVGLFNKTPRLHVMSYAGPPAPAMATARHNAYVYAPRLAAVKPRTAVGSSRLAVLRVCTMFHDSVVSLHVVATSAAVRNATHLVCERPRPYASLSDLHASLSDPHASLSDPHASLSDPRVFFTRALPVAVVHEADPELGLGAARPDFLRDKRQRREAGGGRRAPWALRRASRPIPCPSQHHVLRSVGTDTRVPGLGSKSTGTLARWSGLCSDSALPSTESKGDSSSTSARPSTSRTGPMRWRGLRCTHCCSWLRGWLKRFQVASLSSPWSLAPLSATTQSALRGRLCPFSSGICAMSVKKKQSRAVFGRGINEPTQAVPLLT